MGISKPGRHIERKLRARASHKFRPSEWAMVLHCFVVQQEFRNACSRVSRGTRQHDPERIRGRYAAAVGRLACEAGEWPNPFPIVPSPARFSNATDKSERLSNP